MQDLNCTPYKYYNYYCIYLGQWEMHARMAKSTGQSIIASVILCTGNITKMYSF